VDGLAYPDATVLALAAVALSLITLVIVLTLGARQRKLLNRYRRFLNGSATQDIESLLLAQATSLEQSSTDVALVKAQMSKLSDQVQYHTQKTAILRFNAFPDTGSDLSFAIALLDAHNNGMVISSLYGRSESRVYAKPIQNGTSSYALSEEEKQVLARAMAPAHA
jgi:hypothetical protein